MLKFTGSIALNSKCKGFSKSAVLYPKGTLYSNPFPSDFVPSVNLIDDCCEEIKRSGINLSYIQFNHDYKNSAHHLDELNIASHRLEDIEKIADAIDAPVPNLCINVEQHVNTPGMDGSSQVYYSRENNLVQVPSSSGYSSQPQVPESPLFFWPRPST